MRNRAIALTLVGVLGAIVVSFLGLPASRAAAAGPTDHVVTYLPAAQVTAAFTKGAVLFEGSRYMVHASRRESAGQAEVHVKDADIIYVLDGSATFVTGGELVDGSTTAEDEIRGASIRGGQVRRITKGDVVIVPEGTPHWFKELDAPITYYVVKTR
ncbi:MAG TPA: cupin domain-containing protein [Candidatus Polarisedimenticolia bacterium]|nr:cupin domain-containing protein [Candidatus Polarisedimenticolia bacterium]